MRRKIEWEFLNTQTIAIANVRYINDAEETDCLITVTQPDVEEESPLYLFIQGKVKGNESYLFDDALTWKIEDHKWALKLLHGEDILGNAEEMIFYATSKVPANA